MMYVVEVDAYRPGGVSAPPIGDAFGATPFGALAQLPDVIEVYDTIRASDAGFKTEPVDGAVQVYPPTLDSAFAIDRLINLSPDQAGCAAAWGSITLTNTDRRYDSIAGSDNSDGRGVRIYTGTKVLDPVRGYLVNPAKSSLTPLFAGVAQNWFCSDTALSVPLRDASYFLDRPLQARFYGGTGGLDGGADLIGQPLPRTRGAVFNISPVLVDSYRQIYQWSDGPVFAPDSPAAPAQTEPYGVFDGGAPLTYQGDVADLYSGSTAPSSFRTDKARGLFQIATKPSFQITLSGYAAPGPRLGSSIGATIRNMALSLLLDDALLPSGYIDLAAFDDTGYPRGQIGGGYYTGTNPTTALEILNTLATSMGAKVFPRRDGRLSILYLDLISPGEVPAATLSPANTVSITPTQLGSPLDPPPWKIQAVLRHNYTVQATNLAGIITDTRRAAVGQADQLATWLGVEVKLQYRKANEITSVAMYSSTAAQAIANAWGVFWSARRRLYSVVVPVAVGAQLELGKVVRVIWPMDNLGGGVLGRVVGDQFRGGDATITLQVLV